METWPTANWMESRCVRARALRISNSAHFPLSKPKPPAQLEHADGRSHNKLGGELAARHRGCVHKFRWSMMAVATVQGIGWDWDATTLATKRRHRISDTASSIPRTLHAFREMLPFTLAPQKALTRPLHTTRNIIETCGFVSLVDDGVTPSTTTTPSR